jgi:hypothetical protein
MFPYLAASWKTPTDGSFLRTGMRMTELPEAIHLPNLAANYDSDKG